MNHVYKWVLTLTLLLTPFMLLAKEVGETVGVSGKLVLHDDACKLFPIGQHFQAIDKDGTKTFTGCWLLDNGIVYLVDDKGGTFQTEATNFSWFYDDKKKI